MEPLSLMFGWYGLIVEIDWEGDIIKSWHNPSGTTPGLSEAYFSKVITSNRGFFTQKIWKLLIGVNPGFGGGDL